MKKIINLFALSLIVYGCSSDDDEISCSTFLKCLDGTVWTYDHQNVIYRFNNNMSNPVERWTKCVEPFEGYYLYSGDYYDLLSNTKDELVVETDDGSYTWTFTFVGDEIRVNLNPSPTCGIGRLYESNINVDNLLGCN